MYKLSALTFIYGGHYNKSSRPLKLRTARRITHAFPGRQWRRRRRCGHFQTPFASFSIICKFQGMPVHLESFQDTFLHEICARIYSNLKYRIQIYTERTERSSIPGWNVQFDKCEINIKRNLPRRRPLRPGTIFRLMLLICVKRIIYKQFHFERSAIPAKIYVTVTT